MRKGKETDYDLELEDMDLEDEDWEGESRNTGRRGREDPEDWEDDWEEDSRPMNPWLIGAIFAGLLVLAVIICGLLWTVTHPRGDGRKGTPETSQESGTGQSDGAGEGNGPGQSVGTGEGNGPGQSGEAGEENDPGQPDDAGAGNDPGQSDGSGAETTPGQADGTGDGTGTGTDSGQSAGTQNPFSEEREMTFTDVQESVTAKEATNLRSRPSTLDDGDVVAQIKNGEVVTRTGINSDTGWSRVEYNGQTLYAVSRLLTTDLTPSTPAPPAAAGSADPNTVTTADGRVIVFTDCDDNVSPKMSVNLRLEPSTLGENGTIHCRLEYGEVVHRTGYSEDTGWSRVEHDGHVLYVVTSYIYVVDVTQ